MKAFHCTKGVVKLIIVFVSIIAVSIILLMYIAYIYQPKEVCDYTSDYLKTVKSQYLKTENYDIHYVNEGSGKPVILIHGGGTWLYSYRDNIPFISNYYSIYAVDMPGHGYTKVLIKNPTYNLNMYCEFLLEFIDKLKLDKVSLVGNSWGGGWALYFAEKYPEKVEKLVLIDSSGLASHDVFEWELFKVPIIGEATSKFINNKSVKLSLEKVFYNKEKVDDNMVQEITTPLSFKDNRKAQYMAERNLKWDVVAKGITNINIPTLIIWGKNDKYLDYKYAHMFVEKIKDSELFLIENCGHVAHEDHPEEVNKAIVDFLNTN